MIEAYIKSGYSGYKIAKLLNRSVSGIYKEIKRGTTTQLNSDYEELEVYFAETGQLRYESNRLRSKNVSKSQQRQYQPFLRYIEDGVKNKKYSLDGLVGHATQNKLFNNVVSIRSIYNYIERQEINIKNIDLPQKVRRKEQKESVHRTHKRLRGQSIELRPVSVEDRKEFGHWEIDLVIGANSKDDSVLLTLTERKTRLTYIEKLPNKKVMSVDAGLNRIFSRVGRDYHNIIKTITTDNGVEFSQLYRLEEKGVGVYYAHPYSSWERGSNERNNGLIRRQIPKGKRINRYSTERVREVEEWINDMPRRILGFRTAKEAYDEEVALISSA